MRLFSKAGLVPNIAHLGHTGPITAVSFHSTSGSVDFSDILLTASMDWTVRLWRTEVGRSFILSVLMLNLRQTFNQASSSPKTIKPLKTFDSSSDYVLDAQWHPSHPAMFASADGSGRVDLWNLNLDSEVVLGCFHFFNSYDSCIDHYLVVPLAVH